MTKPTTHRQRDAQAVRMQNDEALRTAISVLNVCSHRMRDAWRLSNQEKDAGGRVKAILPAGMLATIDTVKGQFSKLAEFESEFGISSLLETTAAGIEANHGVMHAWIDPESHGVTTHSWREAVSRVKAGVELSIQPVFDEVAVRTHDWEAACRAAIDMSFGCRAVLGMQNLLTDGSLPEGSRVRKSFINSMMTVEVVSDGHVLGQASDLDAAIEHARTSQLLTRQPHQLSSSDFRSVTAIINVLEGRGKTGLAKNGPERSLAADIEDLHTLRGFLSSAYDWNVAHNPEFQTCADNKEDWVSTSVSRLLSEPVGANFKSHWVPGGGHLVFTKGSGQVHSGAIDAIHRSYVEEAQLQGHDVPAETLSHYGLSRPASGQDRMRRA